MRIRWVVAMVVGAIVVGTAFQAGGAPARRARGLVANLEDATGTPIGVVRFVPTDDGKVAIRVTASGLTPGFHGYHVHATGTCDPAAKDSSGNTVPFFSAGGHYNPDSSAIHGAHAGDMPPMLVSADGTALLRFKTDRFSIKDLMDADGGAVIVHAAPDNLANIPGTTATGEDRYHSHVDDVLGADTATRATGDAGSRFACGVIQRVSN